MKNIRKPKDLSGVGYLNDYYLTAKEEGPTFDVYVKGDVKEAKLIIAWLEKYVAWRTQEKKEK